MKRIAIFFLVLTTLVSSGWAQFGGVPLQAVPVGISESKELQDASASIVGNIIMPDGETFSMLSFDGRDEFIARVSGGYVEIDLVVNAPRAIDKKTGNPKYKAAYQIGNGEVQHAEYRGNNHWLIMISLESLRAGGYHLMIGLDGLVVGRGRNNLDLLLIRVPLPGKDIKEDRYVVAKMIVLDYRGTPDADAVAAFIARRAQEFPLTKRVSWSDRLDGQGMLPMGNEPVGAQPPQQGGIPSTLPRNPAAFEAWSDTEKGAFVVENTSDKPITVTLEGEGMKPITRDIAPGKWVSFSLRKLSDPEAVVFIIKQGSTILARERYHKEEQS